MHRMPMVHAETNGAYQGGFFIVIIIIVNSGILRRPKYTQDPFCLVPGGASWWFLDVSGGSCWFLVVGDDFWWFLEQT